MAQRSPDVRDILGTPPGWLLRYGMAVVLLGCLLLFVVASFFHYPNIVRAPVELTTATPPVPVYAPGSGYVQRLLADEGDTVRAGDILITLDDAAVYEHLLYLEEELEYLRTSDGPALAAYRPDRSLALGAVQQPYDELVGAIENYQALRSNAGSTIQAARGALAARRTEIERLIDSMEAELIELRKAIALRQREVTQADRLYLDGDLSLGQLNVTKAAFQRANGEYQAKLTAIGAKREELAALRQNGVRIGVSGTQSALEARDRIQSSVLGVRRAIDDWKYRHLVRAPAGGIASYYTDLLPANTRLQRGDEFMAIIPPQEELEIVGRLTLSNEESGQVRVGQAVRIKLKDYPFREYGMLWGEVATRSKVPKERTFYLVVSLDRGMVTSLDRSIPFQYNMVGTAEIITEDKQFLERVLGEVWAFFRQFGAAEQQR